VKPLKPKDRSDSVIYHKLSKKTPLQMRKERVPWRTAIRIRQGTCWLYLWEGGDANQYLFVVQTNSGTGANHYSFVVQTYSGSRVD